ncbi:MAG: flagellar basal body-associated protein FliL [Rhodobacterales bacterium]|nr:MAG: flagellar basal body-associated protein FliL [Rhodobacterales bacterium]
MIAKLLPVLLLVLGVGTGIGAGIFLKPEPREHVEINPCGDEHPKKVAKSESKEEETDPTHEYVKLNNQFVVPVVGKNKVSSLVVLSLSVEVEAGQKEAVYAREPKLRDAFLQTLFDHANMGGFEGSFTSSNNMKILRNALREVANKTLGDLVSDVLIIDIVRQDV